MKNKFTPAHWTIAENGFLQMGDQSTDLDAANASPWNTSYEEAKANLTLIAAAPDLLAAMETLLARYAPLYDNAKQADVDAYYDAKAAIAKAKGN
jgi:hypothetical protein